MKINNIHELKKHINRSTVLIFIILFSSALLVVYLTQSIIIQKRHLLNEKEIIATGNIYKSNLSEKLSIIASSTIFLDYLRSGELTRKRLYPQFLSQILSLTSQSIYGMELIGDNKEKVFKYGLSTPFFVSIKLCYLNQTLNPSMGECSFIWKIYFKKEKMLQELLFLNNTLQPCKKCSSYHLITNKKFGSFPLDDFFDFKFKLSTESKKDYFFYIYLLLISSTLIIFGVWSWHRLNSVINNYIANPIKDITNCLKINYTLPPTKNIEEIDYLIREITIWKEKINKVKSDEHFEKLSKVAAQLAHDVRSPLSAIDMLVKKLTDIPENYKNNLRNATQRISDIANNFLVQYKNPAVDNYQELLTNVFIPSLLENLLAEKRNQYYENNIFITFDIHENAWDTFSFTNPIEFTRIVSNLINNSIESIDETAHGLIQVKLYKLNDYFCLEIIDNGCGIPNELIPKILSDGITIGKKDGYGLGVSHAVKKINEWNGTIKINSIIDSQTKITITLPIANKPAPWFCDSFSLYLTPLICILDDDSQVHNLWKYYFNTFQNNIVLKHFFSSNDLVNFATTDLENVLYLIDYDLGSMVANGLEVIEKLNISKKSILVTNRYDNVNIQSSCLSLGVKILPKNLISNILIIKQIFDID